MILKWKKWEWKWKRLRFEFFIIVYPAVLLLSLSKDHRLLPGYTGVLSGALIKGLFAIHHSRSFLFDFDVIAVLDVGDKKTQTEA